MPSCPWGLDTPLPLYSHLGYNVPIYTVTEQRGVACSLASHTQPSVYFRKSQTTCSSQVFTSCMMDHGAC